MIRDTEHCSGLRHRQPLAILLGRSICMDSPHTTQRADTVDSPGLALAGRYTHAVQRGSDVLVRPSCRHVMDQGHRLFGRSAAVFAGFWFADAELRVLATAPMDGEDDLARALVIVRDDV